MSLADEEDRWWSMAEDEDINYQEATRSDGAMASESTAAVSNSVRVTSAIASATGSVP